VSWPDPSEDDAIRLVDLNDFLANPVRRFVKTRLGCTVPERGGIPDDTLPADLDALSRWSVTSGILDGLLAGHAADALLARERGDDTLPSGDLGDDDLDQAMEAANTLWEAARKYGYDRRRHQPYPGVVETARGVVEGTVTADPEAGHLFTVTPSALRGKRRLESFVQLCFLTAVRPETPWKGVLLGKRDQGEGHVAVTLGPIKGDETARRDKAVDMLGVLVDLYIEGHHRPLPLPCDTAYIWQRNGGKGEGRARQQARDKFEGPYGEAKDPAHTLLHPGVATFDALEKTGFADYCSRLWLPILTLSGERPL
jgi:exonuclease V gamma subunit